MAQYRAPTVQKPTLDQLGDIATQLGFHMSREELAEYKALVDDNISHLSAIDDIPEPVLLPVKYPRTPGYRPPKEENKYGAWYYKTDIKGAPSGKLHGKKIAIKDIIPVAGVPMMNGTKLLEGYIPDFDPTIVTRILDSGGHIVGKAVCENMSYSGMSCTSDSGLVLNPHDTTRSTGGSSSGSAVVVQTGEVDMATGGDQGGSIRIPASWVGIVGLKPTYGLVPYTGIPSLDPSVDHAGPMTRTVHDCALLLEVLAGYDGGLDPRQPPDLKVPVYTDMLGGDLSGMKIGLLQEGFNNSERDVSDLVRASVQTLTTVGATVGELSIPLHNTFGQLWGVVCGMGGYVTMIKNAGCNIGLKTVQSTSMIDHMTASLKSRANDMSRVIKSLSLQWEYIQQTYGNRYYAKCQNMAPLLTKAYDDALDKYDVLIMPTTTHKASKFPKQDVTVNEFVNVCGSMAANTAPTNATGHPALSINAGFSEGLPVGMMIVGKKFEDGTVLKVAEAFERIRDQK